MLHWCRAVTARIAHYTACEKKEQLGAPVNGTTTPANPPLSGQFRRFFAAYRDKRRLVMIFAARPISTKDMAISPHSDTAGIGGGH